MFDGGISGYGYNSQLTQWASVARLVRNTNHQEMPKLRPNMKSLFS
jgi:hypothetical protein